MKNNTNVQLALEGAGRHTLIEYMYRDASNYKQTNVVLLDGRLTEAQIEKILASLDDKQFFIPGQVGLQDLQGEFEHGAGWHEQDDHVWHELQTIEYRDGRPNGLKAEDVATAWPTSAEGWNVAEHQARLSGSAPLTPGC
jgi:hypothetical protein